MPYPKPICIGLLLLFGVSLSAHQDFYVVHKSGNVTLTILTGFEFEEINKCRLVAEQVADLCKVLKYKKKIRIDFVHGYVSEPAPTDIFISVDKWKIIDRHNSSPFEPKPKDKGKIYIRIMNDQIPVGTVLKATRFAIENEREIKDCQQQYYQERDGDKWTIYSIEPTVLRERLAKIDMSDIWPVLDQKYYALEERKGGELSYFLQRDSFHVFDQQNGWTERKLLSTTRLHQLASSSRDFGFGLIFISRLKLISINYFNNGLEISKPVDIPGGYIPDPPMQVLFIGNRRAIIPMWLYDIDKDESGKMPQDILYSHEEQKVIVNLDGVLRQLFKK